LLEQTVSYCLKKEYTVIVESILSKPKYKDTLVKLADSTAYTSHFFYIDVSLEETLKRHKTKPIADEVTDEQLRSWYQPKNYLDVPGEVIIDETSTLDETVNLILDSV
jgi:predicted kinase